MKEVLAVSVFIIQVLFNIVYLLVQFMVWRRVMLVFALEMMGKLRVVLILAK